MMIFLYEILVPENKTKFHLRNKFIGPIYFIKPARSAGFSQIKKIPYQAPPTQLGPRKCTF